MSVWYVIPSARPPEEAEKVLKLWRERGYKVALWLDQEEIKRTPYRNCDLALSDRKYPGYAKAVNQLIKKITDPLDEFGDENELHDPTADWFVTGGDDTEPDPNHSAEEIARECSLHFGQHHYGIYYNRMPAPLCTFGVMQCTGDRWHEGVGGFTNAPIDRVCGSPWMGREFCRRIYGGNGPLWPEYEHQYVDEELQNVAEKLGILWQRRDLIHRHNHWGRGPTDHALVADPVIPPHLEKWNTSKHWNEAKAIFQRRKEAGFEPLGL